MRQKFLHLFLGLFLLVFAAACASGQDPQIEVPDINIDVPDVNVDVPSTSADPTAEPAAEADPVSFEMFYPVAVDAPIAAILEGYVHERFETSNISQTASSVK